MGRTLLIFINWTVFVNRAIAEGVPPRFFAKGKEFRNTVNITKKKQMNRRKILQHSVVDN